jgi:hypothetical protein
MAGEQNVPELKSFEQVMVRLDDGRVNDALSEGVRDIVAAMHADAEARSGTSKGELTLKLKFNFEAGEIRVVPDLKITTPKERYGKTLFWANEANNLTPENPKQKKFQFGVRQVEDGAPARKLEEPAPKVKQA